MTPKSNPLRKETDPTRANRLPNWRDLGRAAASEQDPAKVLERDQELIRALDAESQERMEHLPAAKDRHKAAT
jgi:hypothetical protein